MTIHALVSPSPFMKRLASVIVFIATVTAIPAYFFPDPLGRGLISWRTLPIYIGCALCFAVAWAFYKIAMYPGTPPWWLRWSAPLMYLVSCTFFIWLGAYLSTDGISKLPSINLFRGGTFEGRLDSRLELHDKPEFVTSYNNTQAICFRQTALENEKKQYAGVRQLVSVTAHKTYMLQAWLNWKNATGLHMKVEWYADQYKMIEPAWFYRINFNEASSSQAWEQRSFEVTAPEGATNARVYIWHGVVNDTTNAPGGTVCVDDVVFSERS